jgi:hypothetical protein
MSVHLFHAFGLRSAILRLHPAARSRNSERAEGYDCVPAVAMRNTGVLTHDGGLSRAVLSLVEIAGDARCGIAKAWWALASLVPHVTVLDRRALQPIAEKR